MFKSFDENLYNLYHLLLFQFQSRGCRPREEGGRRVRLPDGVYDGGVHRRTKLRPHTDRKSPRLQRIRNRAAPELAVQVKKKNSI